jgi:DNA primase
MYLDINRIKREITMLMLLQHYGITLRRSGQHRLTGTCPLHHGDNPNAFHLDTEKNLFRCFTRCGGGSIFDFVMKKEGLSFYPAALKIYNIFYARRPQSAAPHIQKPPPLRKNTAFKLDLQFDHPYLRQRNITPQLARFFQMGFCASGMMKQRIAIPIIDMDKNIAAYCGRAVYRNCSPKYLFPGRFQKSKYLFNLQNLLPRSPNPVFIVEGFFDCIHIHTCGFDALALMGTTISSAQVDLLRHLDRQYILMLDGDEAGKKATHIIKAILKKEAITCHPVYLIHKKEPELLGRDELELFADRDF